VWVWVWVPIEEMQTVGARMSDIADREKRRHARWCVKIFNKKSTQTFFSQNAAEAIFWTAV
jgi:hypothetical protein